MENLAYYNGKIDSINNMMIPMNDRAVYFGDGVYDVVLCLNRKHYCIKPHLDRLYNSAKLLKIEMPIPEDELFKLTDELSAKVDSEDQIIYYQVSRATAPRAHEFPKGVKANLMITVKPVKVKPTDRRVSLISVPDNRFSICNIKTINLIPNCMAEQEAIDAGCMTAVFVRDGLITECAHSNIHIIKDGVIYTHPTDNLILPGIARSNLLRIAAANDIPLVERPFSYEEMMNADEVFMTSTSTIIVRVSEIDKKAVGCGNEELFNRLRFLLLDDLYEATGKRCQ